MTERKAPMSGYLEFEAQPPKMTPKTEIDDRPRTMSSPTGLAAIQSVSV